MQFHELKVKRVERNTPDAISIHFEVPEELKAAFQYKPGQYLILQVEVNGEKLRRAYSLCSCPDADEHLIVTSKRVEQGRVSNYLNDHLKAGDTLSVFPPQGNFTIEMDGENARLYVLIGAGSGITPLMSILRTTLLREPKSQVILFYGNHDEASIIFKDQLDKLAAEYKDRLTVVHVLSQPGNEWEGLKGRLSKFKLKQLIKEHAGHNVKAAEYFICGPGGMMDMAKSTLEDQDIPKAKIHIEYFTAPLPDLDKKEKNGSDEQQDSATGVVEDEEVELETREVKVTLDGDEHILTVEPDQTILEAAIEKELDPPFACQMGICTTCRATLRSGKVMMDEREGLSDEEVEDGFILTCQSHPLTDDVEVEYA